MNQFNIGDRVSYKYLQMYIEGQIYEIYNNKNTALIVLLDGTKYELELNFCKKINNYTK